MDFIKKLPSFSSFDNILVIVDYLLKQAIFILTHNTITSAELACLFVVHVLKNMEFHLMLRLTMALSLSLTSSAP